MVGGTESGIGRKELQLGTIGKMNWYGRVTGEGTILYAGLCLLKGVMQGGCELQGQGGGNWREDLITKE